MRFVTPSIRGRAGEWAPRPDVEGELPQEVRHAGVAAALHHGQRRRGRRPRLTLDATPHGASARVPDAGQDFLPREGEAPEDRAQRDDMSEAESTLPPDPGAPHAGHDDRPDRDHVEEQPPIAGARVRPLRQRDPEEDAETHARPDSSRSRRRARGPETRKRSRAHGGGALGDERLVEGPQLLDELIDNGCFLVVAGASAVLVHSGQPCTSDRASGGFDAFSPGGKAVPGTDGKRLPNKKIEISLRSPRAAPA